MAGLLTLSFVLSMLNTLSKSVLHVRWIFKLLVPKGNARQAISNICVKLVSISTYLLNCMISFDKNNVGRHFD